MNAREDGRVLGESRAASDVPPRFSGRVLLTQFLGNFGYCGQGKVSDNENGGTSVAF